VETSSGLLCPLKVRYHFWGAYTGSPAMNSPDAERTQSGAAEVSSHGEIRYGEGRVLAYEIIGTIGKFNLVSVRLEVLPPQGEAYEMTEQWVIPDDAQLYLQVGVRIPVGITSQGVDFVDPLFGNVSRAVSKPTDKLSQIITTLFPRDAEGMAITDADRRILWINETLEKTSGYRLEELRGKFAVKLLFGALTDAATVSRIRSALRRRESCSEELVLYHKDGHPYWTRLTYSPILVTGGFVRALVVIVRALPEKPLP
jgi:PAS domain S-box-containing protein